MGHLLEGLDDGRPTDRQGNRSTTYEGDARRRRACASRSCAARFNDHITDRLLDGARDGLVRHGVDRRRRSPCVWVPGAFEIPLVAKRLAGSGEYDAVICLGAVIRGDTAHFDYVAGECRGGHPAGRSSTRRAGGLRRAHHRHHRAGARAGRRRRPATRASRRPRPRSRWSTCCVSSRGRPEREPRPHAAARPAQGLARARPPSSCSRTPTSRSRAAPTSTTAATIDDPRIDEVRILRPQEIPQLRRRGPVRPRHHRPRLDRGDRRRRRVARRAPLLEGDAPDPIRIVLAVGGRLAGRARSRTCRRACGSPPSTRS